MAQRRMLSKDITETDGFYTMSHGAQALYMHFVLNADDDGFVSNAEIIARTMQARKKDRAILAEKGYIIEFESGVIVIKHWLCMNKVQESRHIPTLHTQELLQLNTDNNKQYSKKLSSECQQNDDKMSQSIGEDRRVKDSIGEVSANDDTPPHNDVDALISEYNISNAVADAVKRWIDYKNKSGKPLNEVSLQSLFERVEQYSQKYKASDIIEIIRTSISAQYKDIVFVRLDEKREREKGFDRFAVWGDTECINDDEILNDTKPEEVKEPIRAPQKQFNTDNAIDHYDFSDEVSKSYKRWVKQKGNFDKKETDIFAHCTMLFGSDIAVKVLERCISEELKEVDFERLFNEVFAE